MNFHQVYLMDGSKLFIKTKKKCWEIYPAIENMPGKVIWQITTTKFDRNSHLQTHGQEIIKM